MCLDIISRPPKAGVAGSIPAGRTNLDRGSRESACFCFPEPHLNYTRSPTHGAECASYAVRLEPVAQRVIHPRLPAVAACPEAIDYLGVVSNRYRDFWVGKLWPATARLHLRELFIRRLECVRIVRDAACNRGFFFWCVTNQFGLLFHSDQFSRLLALR